MEALSLAEAMTRFEEVAARVARTHQRVRIRYESHGDLVLVSALELESLEATLELLCEPREMQRIGEAEDAAHRGDVISADDLPWLMAESDDTMG